MANLISLAHTMSFRLVKIEIQMANLGELIMKLLGFFLMFVSFYQLEQGYITLSGIIWFIVGGAMFFHEILLTIWTVKYRYRTRGR